MGGSKVDRTPTKRHGMPVVPGSALIVGAVCTAAYFIRGRRDDEFFAYGILGLAVGLFSLVA